MPEEIEPQAAYFRAKKLAYLANVTLNQLCGQAGVDPSTVWRWAKGHQMPSAETLQKLEDASAELQKSNPFLNSVQ